MKAATRGFASSKRLQAVAALTRARLRSPIARARPLALRHGAAAGLYFVAVLVLMWPMFGPGSPPGVDSPTFLHLGWVVDRLFTGNLGSVFSDPYWYGGWPYAAAYPPLAYGAIGLLSAISPIPIEISFRIIVFLAYVGIGLSVYALSMELGVRRSIATWTGLLALLSYPIFVSLGIFGWFSTIVALPLGVAGFAVVERALRTSSHRAAVVGGVLLAASLLAHHMTGFAFGIGMVPWAAYRLLSSEVEWRRTLRLLAYVLGGFLAVAGIWMLFFFPLIITVGFEREIAGNWDVDVSEMRRRALTRGFIGREAYPTYIGLIQIPLAMSGVIYAVVTRARALGAALVLIVFTWFAFGANAMPLINYWPFASLDIARFSVFMVVFLAVMAGVFVEAIASDVVALGSRLRIPRYVLLGGVAAAALALLIVPIQDGLEARDTLAPVQRPPQLDLAMDWIRAETPEDATVLAVGFRNWDDWWVPAQTERAVMDGWNDEGAEDWRVIREVRHMGWFGNVNGLRLYNIMDDRDTDYLFIYHWQPLDSPQLFEAAAGQDPFLFQRRATWPGVSIFERLERGS